METTVKLVDDFELTGDGSAAGWQHAAWLPLTAVKGIGSHPSKAKVVYSPAGIYCLFDCEDLVLTCSNLKDNDDIWNEDVVEAFFWPDQSQDLYLEYELSPLGVELPLIIPNNGGKFMGWAPWHTRGID